MRLRTWIAPVLGSALAAGLLAGCSASTAAPPQAATTPHNVTLTKAQRQRIHILTIAPGRYHTTLTTSGIVTFDRNRATKVVAPFSGAVTKVLVALGDKVTTGQPLAQVHSPQYAAAIGAYRKAVLAASAADAVARNDRALYAQHAISQRENAQAQATAAGADADRDAARQALVALHLSHADIAAIGAGKAPAHAPGVIRAPIAGTVVARSIAPGQTLTAGTTPCFTLADTSKMWVLARLFGAEIAKVQVGDRARIITGDGAKPLVGKVTNVGAVVEPATRAVTARVAVDNPDNTLKKAMYVSVSIASQTTHAGILIPVGAMLRDEQNLPFVYVLAKGGGYARRPVTLGPRVGQRFVIEHGLRAGDKVVVDGGIFLRFMQTQ